MNLHEIELAAAHGEKRPGMLMSEEKLFFEASDLLYRAWRSGVIQKEDAIKIKKRILSITDDLIRQREAHWADQKRWNACEALLSEAKINGCDICKQIEKALYPYDEAKIARRG